jgi:hypothetical protein
VQLLRAMITFKDEIIIEHNRLLKNDPAVQLKICPSLLKAKGMQSPEIFIANMKYEGLVFVQILVQQPTIGMQGTAVG